jgi:endonuclease YncB( thermonuclease family)
MKALVAAVASIAVLVTIGLRTQTHGASPAAAAGAGRAPVSTSPATPAQTPSNSAPAPASAPRPAASTRRRKARERTRRPPSHPAAPTRRAAPRIYVVSRVVDGDTIDLANGATIRFLQIDTPELSSGECYATHAKALLERLLPVGARVSLARDPGLDRVDRYGRLLRYVIRGSTNLNVAMVRRGAAAPYFYGGDRGLHAATLLGAAERARHARIGLWRACPGTRLEPDAAVSTGDAGAPAGGGSAAAGASGSGCTPGYSPCLPVRDDWDCGELSRAYRVTGSDPYRLDGDGDGYGCE